MTSTTSTIQPQAVVRRELSDNFCFYNPRYDSLTGAAGWAQETLAVHASDVREHVYSAQELEGENLSVESHYGLLLVLWCIVC